MSRAIRQKIGVEIDWQILKSQFSGFKYVDMLHPSKLLVNMGHFSQKILSLLCCKQTHMDYGRRQSNCRHFEIYTWIDIWN